ncbi:MAG: hypothetical protein IT477_10330 [Rhodanobacteraceae bacterium]|nr:hypothetical protein [Rhodanobacteraceae bacterium]
MRASADPTHPFCEASERFPMPPPEAQTWLADGLRPFGIGILGGQRRDPSFAEAVEMRWPGLLMLSQLGGQTLPIALVQVPCAQLEKVCAKWSHVFAVAPGRYKDQRLETWLVFFASAEPSPRPGPIPSVCARIYAFTEGPPPPRLYPL